MSGHVVKHSQSHKKQSGNKQTHYEIPYGGHYGFSRILGHNYGTGRQGVYLYKYVSGKCIICIYERQHGTKQQVHH